MSLEDGTVQGFDIRAVKSDSSSDSKPSFILHAHDSAVCTVSYNPSVPGVGVSVLKLNIILCIIKLLTLPLCYFDSFLQLDLRIKW